MKKKIFALIGIVFLVAILVIVFKIWRFRGYSITDIRVDDNKLSYNSNIKRKEREYIKIDGEKNRDITKVDGLNIFMNNNKINLKSNIYEKNLRYYIALEDAINLGQAMQENNKFLNKTNGNYIDLDNKKIYINNKLLSLRGEILEINNEKYISINDLNEILNLKDDWYKESKSIYLFNEKDNIIKPDYKVDNGKAALIRIEDVSAGGVFSKDNNMEKMKYLGDYFKANNIAFHIAWIPRYINPKENIDNDLLKNNDFENVHFINMLDYLINRGAVVGLHGYTHQHNKEISGVGVELKWNVNSNRKNVLNVINSALKTANTLNIPIGFFESPHYKADRGQQKIIENYFPIMFEPYAGYWNLNPLISLSNRSTLYVPAPLGYVKDDGQTVANRIESYSNEILTAFFIHPYKFLGSIKDEKSISNKEQIYGFSEDSPIIKILSALKERGCRTITVDELNNQVK
ncbi:polysaccharide deacetylase family protein [Clostridium sp. B9]|uniref:polysaccharide deacetylase family protein n=1 Tax=Clostridium sp. B9 TaxID=3423224 RepID=UPI003D2F4622